MSRSADMRAEFERMEAANKILRARIDQAVSDLDAEHRPEWDSDEMKARGEDPFGCAVCWPTDGSWPCVASIVADDIRNDGRPRRTAAIYQPETP